MRGSTKGNWFLFFQGCTLQYKPTSYRVVFDFLCLEPEKKTTTNFQVFFWFNFFLELFIFPEKDDGDLPPNIVSVFYFQLIGQEKRTGPACSFTEKRQKLIRHPGQKNQQHLVSLLGHRWNRWGKFLLPVR